MSLAGAIRGLTIQINGDVGGLKSALGSVSNDAMTLSRKLDNIGKNVTNIGKDLTAKVTTPIVAGFTAAIKTTANFDDAMARVAAVTSKTGQDNAANMEILRDRAREMGEQTLHSATDVADAMYYMGLAGWDTQEIYEGIPGVLDLATASGEDLARVSDIVTDAMTAFGLEAKDTSHFVDVLAQTTRNSNTDVDQLGEAFKYVAPMAGAMGYSVDDVAMALGLMANNGIKGSMAGTALRNVIQRMAKPTKESGEAMEALGLSMLNADGSAKTLSEIMDEMRGAFGNLLTPSAELQVQIDDLNKQMDDGSISEEEYVEQMEALADAAYGAGSAEKVRYAAMLAGARGMPGLLAVVNTAEKDYTDLAGAIDKADGSTREMSSLMENTTTGQFKILISKLAELAIQFGDILTPVLKEVINYLKGIVDWLNKLPEPTKEMIVKIAAVAAAIGPLIMVIGGLIGGINNVVAAFGLLASPAGVVIAIIAAIAAAVAILIIKWDDVKYYCQVAIDAIKDTWEDMKNSISRRVSEIGSAIKNGVTAAVDTMKFIWESAKIAASDTWNDIKRTVTTRANQVRDGVSSAFSTMRDKFTGIMDTLKTSASERFNSIKDTIKSRLEQIKNLFNFEWKLPKIKLPHFSWTWKDVGGLVKLPNIKVEWYKKAYDNPYLFTNPTVMNGRGFGDGHGSGEIVYGRDQLMRDITEAAQGDITINVYATDGMNINQLADKIQQRLAQVQRQRMAAYV